MVDDIRVRGIGSYNDIKLMDDTIEECITEPKIEERVKCYFDELVI